MGTWLLCRHKVLGEVAAIYSKHNCRIVTVPRLNPHREGPGVPSQNRRMIAEGLLNCSEGRNFL